MAEVLEYLVRLRGAREAAADADLVAESQNRVARSSMRVKEESGIAATAFGRSAEKMKESARGIAGLALGGVAMFAGFEGIKHAVEDTQSLVVQATSLARVTGMNVNEATQWLAVSSAFGIQNRTLTMSFRTLATQVQGATDGTKKSKDAFKALGITSDELKSHSHDVGGMLGLVADHLNTMPGGIRKTQLASQLLGRGWQQLIPMLSEGSKGMEELRKTAAAYGVTLGRDPLKNARLLHEAEIKLHLAQIGMQVFIATKLAPAFIKLFGVALNVYKALRNFLAPAIKDATDWFKRHHDIINKLLPVLKVLAGAIVAVLVTGKVIAFGKSLANTIGTVGKVGGAIFGLIGKIMGLRGAEDLAGASADGMAGKLAGAIPNIGRLITALAGPAGLAFALSMVGNSLGNIISGGWSSSPNAQNTVSPTGPGNPTGNQGVAGGATILGIHIGGPGGAILHGLGVGARGAVVNRPTLAMIGEAGREAVVPLDRTPGNQRLPLGGAPAGDLIFKIGEHEFARIAKRALWQAMAANA